LKAKKIDMRDLLFGEKKSKRNGISAWSTRWDPRIPSKGKIIHEYENILYSYPTCETAFEKGSIIPCNRRLKNMTEIIEPTIPNRFPDHRPDQEKEFLPTIDVTFVSMHQRTIRISNLYGMVENGSSEKILHALPRM
jgi:hypothetical protein